MPRWKVLPPIRQIDKNTGNMKVTEKNVTVNAGYTLPAGNGEQVYWMERL